MANDWRVVMLVYVAVMVAVWSLLHVDWRRAQRGQLGAAVPGRVALWIYVIGASWVAAHIVYFGFMNW